MMRNIETRAIEVPGGTLFTANCGERTKPAVVMIHSGLGHAQMWYPLMRAVGDEVFCIAYDCRCCGRSTTTLDGVFSDTADLADVLDGHGLESAVLLAASRGGRIAIDFALAHPERVDGLFLAAPDISGFDAPVADHERPLMETVEAAEDAWSVEEIIAGELRLFVDGPTRGPSDSREALYAEVTEMLRLNYTQQEDTPKFLDVVPAAGRLAELRGPIRVLVGDADTTGMQAMAAAIDTACEQATLLRVPDAAHMLPMEHPALFEDEFRSWARTVTASKAPDNG
ncbi:3-oxoadipate enol-lactonase [Catenulispora sp. GP43]|uniref:alpha/beta fold hydrolase n=1 Tax=Catenulispora sp. GP43 TaxID=3156263 RepID=UPI0035170F87